MTKLFDLTGKKAIVTGGTRGIGYPSDTSLSSPAAPQTPRDPLDGRPEEPA